MSCKYNYVHRPFTVKLFLFFYPDTILDILPITYRFGSSVRKNV